MSLVEGALVRTYTHTNAQIAVLVDVASSDVSDARVVEFADDLTLQVASMRPLYMVESEVPAELVAKQREILSAQMDKEDAESAAAPAEFLKRVELLLVERAQEEGTTIENPPAAVEAHLGQSEKDRGTLEGSRRKPPRSPPVPPRRARRSSMARSPSGSPTWCCSTRPPSRRTRRPWPSSNPRCP